MTIHRKLPNADEVKDLKLHFFKKYDDGSTSVSAHFKGESIVSLSNYDENEYNELNNENNYCSMTSNMNGWQCDDCTFLNAEWSLYCEMCNKHNPLCLSLNNVTINKYIDTDNNCSNLFIETDDYEILNNTGYDEDDFNDNIQCVLMETASNSIDDIENKTNHSVDSNNKNIDCSMITGYFNSNLGIKQNEDFINVIYRHENSENNNDNNYNGNLHFVKKNSSKNKSKSSFKQYWLEMKQYNKKNKQNHPRRKKEILEKPKRDTAAKIAGINKINLKKSKKDIVARLFAKMVANYPLLKGNLRSIESLKDEFQSLYSSVSFNMHFIVRPKWIRAFYKEYKQNDDVSTTFHGTNCKNDLSIFHRGLIIGSKKDVPIVHGSSYGNGIYCSPSLPTAASYSQGSIYICLARNPKKVGNIWVVHNEKNILPCFLLSYHGTLS